MEHNILRLDLSVLHVDFITNEADWYVLADSDKIFVPFRNILISDARANIEHDNAAMAANVIPITKSSQFFLAGCVPNIEFDKAFRSMERHWSDLDTKSSNVLLFELASQVSLDKGCFTNTSITYEHQFKLGDCFLSLHFLDR